MGLKMTDAEYKECTLALKSLADVKSLAVDDADGIIRAFHRNIKLGKTVKPMDLLPNATDEQRTALAEAEQEVSIPQKRSLDETAEFDNKRARITVES